jgi:hypothetical protein
MTDRDTDEIRVEGIRPPRPDGKFAVRIFSKSALTARMRSLGYEVVATLGLLFREA